MIRLAFILVTLLGGLIAFGAFHLVRGNQADVPQITTFPASPAEEATQTAPTPPAPPVVERLYYLREIDFDQGEITVLYFGAGPEGSTLVIRDQDPLKAARTEAYVNTSATGGEAVDSFVMDMMGAPPDETIVQIYRRDSLIAAVTCVNTACGRRAQNPDINHAGLTDHATPYQVINDQFDDHATYLETIHAVSESPDFMLLDQRPQSDFPAERRVPNLKLALPTVVHPTVTAFDAATHEALLRAAIDPLLPDGAEVENITITDLGHAVLADKDNNQPVTAGGAPIPFPDAQYFGVQAQINGTAALTEATLDQITAATTRSFDLDAPFAEFVTARLQTTCVDCYFLKVDGTFVTQARAITWRNEVYDLSYYDLREAP
ncbi:hypothetical protein [Octadecabacter ascidiaceicola]|uniref:Uncharacterized protein n=1 Tax=Octadecabacter ascidiaceicola TaxID=1655543 RepID=A0A238K6U0_9RHOB|nr:hypothetical protein [Octadecabacter ascidiaceicola]SMX37666.1 hypothetical protein OCA8868_01524 [Octadecabacter ascidiaceicola]